MVHFVSAREVLLSGEGQIREEEASLTKNNGKTSFEFTNETLAWNDAHIQKNENGIDNSVSNNESSPSTPSSSNNNAETIEWIGAFKKLEDSLRSFILEKRTKSKLAPAKLYMEHVLSDISFISRYNLSLSRTKSGDLDSQIQAATPFYNQMIDIKSKYLDSIDKLIEQTGAKVHQHATKDLTLFLEDIEPIMDIVDWHGILYSLNYANSLHKLILRLANIRIQKCMQVALKATVELVEEINQETSHCFPTDISVDEKVIINGFENLTLQCNLPSLDAFDLLDILKEYIPGLSLVMSGLFGLRYMPMTFKFINLGKMSLSVLAVCGIF